MPDDHGPFATDEQHPLFRITIEHFANIDPLTDAVIKGHLVMEEKLNAILRKCVYHPSHLEQCNLRFHQALNLARAFCVSPKGAGIWELMASMNTLRNAMAHSLDPANRQVKFQKVKEIYLRELEDPAIAEQDRQQPDDRLFLLALALCNGYLEAMDRDATLLQRVFGGIVQRMADRIRAAEAEGQV